MNYEAALAQAVKLHEIGRLPEAKEVYRRISALAPDHADGLHLLGLIAHQEGQSDRAIQLIMRAVRVNCAASSYYDN